MKNLIALFLIVTLAFACNTKTKEETMTVDQTAIESTDTISTPAETGGEAYACPMHPEVTGIKDAECSKCGMPLTEPVGS